MTQRVLITGAASGLGAALATAFEARDDPFDEGVHLRLVVATLTHRRPAERDLLHFVRAQIVSHGGEPNNAEVRLITI